MKLEQQVCSLKLAKRLKELGVKQESLYGWRKKNATWQLWSSGVPEDFVGDESYSAFTVAELGEMLPRGTSSGLCVEGDATKTGGNAICQDHIHSPIFARTEADARAAMLIYLIEKKLITV